jgi:hypothetical protein
MICRIFVDENATAAVMKERFGIEGREPYFFLELSCWPPLTRIQKPRKRYS